MNQNICLNSVNLTNYKCNVYLLNVKRVINKFFKINFPYKGRTEGLC